MKERSILLLEGLWGTVDDHAFTLQIQTLIQTMSKITESWQSQPFSDCMIAIASSHLGLTITNTIGKFFGGGLAYDL